MAEVNATEVLQMLPKNLRGVVTESARANGKRFALTGRSRKRKPGLLNWVCVRATA
jgi:hypothetical protein